MGDNGEQRLTSTAQVLADARTILLVDWPSRDVPDTLARHGLEVVSKDGPGDADYNAYELDGGSVRVCGVGRRPDRADLIYSHRPIDELPEIVATAKAIGVRTVWSQSGMDATGAKDPHGCWLPAEDARKARDIVERAGLRYIDAPYIADVARQMR